MKEHKFDYYIISHGDQHFSEDIPESEERIKYLSGFSGSAGTIIVSMYNAYHQKCWNLLSPLVIDLNDDVTLKWLEVQCTPF